MTTVNSSPRFEHPELHGADRKLSGRKALDVWNGPENGPLDFLVGVSGGASNEDVGGLILPHIADRIAERSPRR